jgi:hypothetical protein
MKTFLLVFDYTSVTQVDVLAFADSRREVMNYFVPVLGTVLLVVRSDQDSERLTELFHTRFPSMMFAVAPVDPASAAGWMPATFWDLVNDPRSSGRWDDAAPVPASPRLSLRRDGWATET